MVERHSLLMTIGKLMKVIAITIVVVMLFLPAYWIITSSFKTIGDMHSIPPTWISWIFHPTLRGYEIGLIKDGFLRSFFDSLIIGIGSSIFVLILAIPAAYALARFSFRGREKLALFLLTLLMIPHIVLVIPVYFIYMSIKLYDTHIGIITMHTLINLPFIIWLLRAFFLGMEKNLEDAAMVDGCTVIGAIIRIVLPLELAGIVTAFIFSFMYSWNEFLFSLVLTGKKVRPGPVAIAGYVTLISVEWGPLFGCAVTFIVPIVTIAILIQKNFVKGLTAGAIKG